MKTSIKKMEDKDINKSSVKTLDLFAKDFFKVPGESTEVRKVDSANSIDIDHNKKIEPEHIISIWSKSLPKFTNSEVSNSNQINTIPNELSQNSLKSLKKTLSHFTQIDEDSIFCKLLSISEVNLENSIKKLTNKKRLFISFNFEKNQKSPIISISSEFASNLIDLILTTNEKSFVTLRQISAIELTIIEFLTLNIISDINNIGNTRFYLQDVSSIFESNFDEYERGLELTLNLDVRNTSGLVTFLLPTGFCSFLDKSEQSIFHYPTKKQKFEKIKKIKNDWDINILIGKTQINAEEITFLEKDDVILIEETQIKCQDGNFPKFLSVFIGDDTNFYINGKVQKSASSNEKEFLTEEITIQVLETISRLQKRSQLKREQMNSNPKEEEIEETIDKESDDPKEILEASDSLKDETLPDKTIEESDEQFASIENLMINLRVNLGGRRLNLNEIQHLKVGQIIELGCRPTDPVEIVTDSENKPIAIGELIDIEGQLGVRLTKIFI